MHKIRKWTKFIAVSCNHGNLIRDDAVTFLQNFIADYQPKVRVHLGDNWDLAALRSGAIGSSDEAEELEGDLVAGERFLHYYEPTIFCVGNHDYRAYKLCHHYNATLKFAAQGIVDRMEKACKHAEILPYKIDGNWKKLGGVKFGHGFMFNENAARDHAESFGSCVIGHLHRAQRVSARRDDNSVCHVIGCLADFDKMTYAHQRRAFLQWENAFAWGEFCDDDCVIRLETRTKNGWRTPIENTTKNGSSDSNRCAKRQS